MEGAREQCEKCGHWFPRPLSVNHRQSECDFLKACKENDIELTDEDAESVQ